MLRSISIALLFITVSFHKAQSYQSVDDIKDSETFDLESFIYKMNNSGESQSLESTLVELKKEEPHFFSNYILMYKSRSLQTSSYLYPRVLLASENSTTVISYNGDSKDHGYNKLEVMRFDPDKATFKFNEISFLDGSLELSQDNPQKCMNCHQNSDRVVNDPRPNWEPYSVWPGAYSSVPFGGGDLSNPNSRRYDPILAEDAANENEMYREFLNTVALEHPRYKLLTPMSKNHKDEFFPAMGKLSDEVNKFTTDFTDELLNLNVMRIARLMQASKISKDYKWATYSSLKCREFFMPEDLFQWHQKNSDTGLERTFSIHDTAKAIEFLFHPYEISTQDWSMDFGTGGKYAFRSRFGGPSSFKSSLLKAMREQMPELRSQSCKDLKEKVKSQSFQETQAYRDLIDQKEMKGTEQSQPLLSRCVDCHTSYTSGAPYIPFDEESKLASALEDQGYLRGTLREEILYRIGPHAEFFERMPKDGYLPTTDEVKALENYIKNL